MTISYTPGRDAAPIVNGGPASITYVPNGTNEQTNVYRREPIRVDQGSIRVSVNNDEMTVINDPRQTSKGVAELNPFHGDGTFAATARNASGVPVTQLRPDTLVTIDGIEGPVSSFVRIGRLFEKPDGTYSEAAPTATQEASVGDVLPMPESTMGAINAAIDRVPQQTLDALTATSIAVAVGKLDQSRLVQKFSELSGYGGEEAQSRIAVLQQAYQQQTDTALMTRSGLGEDDLPAFYQWARENQPQQMMDALQLQMQAHDVSGWRKLASRWMSNVAPNAEAFERAGIATRKGADGKLLVLLKGTWMSAQSAAKAGFI